MLFRSAVVAMSAAVAITIPLYMNRGRQTYELVQKQLTDHPAKQYVPITVSPLGTNSLFVGKGDGEGVSMKTKTQQLTIVENGEKRMEAGMTVESCKAWGMRMARRRALHLTDKAGTPEDRRIAQHCQKIFMARLHHDKVSDLIRKRHMKKAQAVAQAQAQSQAQAHKAPAVEAPAAKHAVTQAKRLTKGKAPPKTAWWKNKHFGFNKNLHMRKTPKAVETPAHKAEAQDLAAFEKMGLA